MGIGSSLRGSWLSLPPQGPGGMGVGESASVRQRSLLKGGHQALLMCTAKLLQRDQRDRAYPT